MKVIFVVSPDYLEACYKEAQGYDFFLQGYGSLEAASKGLLKTNAFDILGFVYLAQALPEDLNPLVNFMLKCNLLHSNRKFIFALQDNSNLSNIFNAVKFDNLRISYLPSVEVVTDSIINKDIFGSILLDNYKPYLLQPEERPALSDFSFNKLVYKPLFPDSFLRCLDPVEKLDSVEHTLLYDSIYQDYTTFNPKLAEIRKGFVLREFGHTISKKDYLDLIKDESVNYCLYRVLVQALTEGDTYEENFA